MTVFNPAGPFQGRHSFIAGFAVVDSDSGASEVIEVSPPGPIAYTYFYESAPSSSGGNIDPEQVEPNLAAQRANPYINDTPQRLAEFWLVPWKKGAYTVLGDGTECYWDGNSWETGRSPFYVYIAPTQAVAVNAMDITPALLPPPANLAALRTVGFSQMLGVPTTTPWISGSWVDLGDGSFAHWDGNSWEAGKAP